MARRSSSLRSWVSSDIEAEEDRYLHRSPVSLSLWKDSRIAVVKIYHKGDEEESANNCCNVEKSKDFTRDTGVVSEAETLDVLVSCVADDAVDIGVCVPLVDVESMMGD